MSRYKKINYKYYCNLVIKMRKMAGEDLELTPTLQTLEQMTNTCLDYKRIYESLKAKGKIEDRIEYVTQYTDDQERIEVPKLISIVVN